MSVYLPELSCGTIQMTSADGFCYAYRKENIWVYKFNPKDN